MSFYNQNDTFFLPRKTFKSPMLIFATKDL